MTTSPQPKSFSFWRVADRWHVDAENVHDEAVEHCVGYPSPEDAVVEELVVLTEAVVAWLGHETSFGKLEVKDRIVEAWQSRHVHVVHLVDEWLVKGLSAED